MNRIDRLTAILVQLQSKRVVKAQEIADRFQISLRTVYRDIRALEAAGIPIGAEAGIGYFIAKGYHLPPVMFTKDEAGAMLLAGKLVEKNSDQGIRNNFDSALTKVRSVLHESEKEYLETIENQIAVLALPQIHSDDFPNIFIRDIQEALAEGRVLYFDYFSNHTGEFNDREAEPLGLVFYSEHWHLIAYCRLRKAIRDFRCDRISKLEIRPDHFDPTSHVSYEEYLQNLVSGNDLNKAEVLFDPEVVRFMGNQKYHYGLVEESLQDGKARMVFAYSSLEYLSRWLLMFGSHVNVKSPVDLKDRLRSLSSELYQHHR